MHAKIRSRSTISAAWSWVHFNGVFLTRSFLLKVREVFTVHTKNKDKVIETLLSYHEILQHVYSP